MTAESVGGGVRNGTELVRRARVLSETGVVEVDFARCVEDDVFEQGAGVVGGGVNLRLSLSAQTDNLRVTSPLEIKDTFVGPAELVVADELVVGARR